MKLKEYLLFYVVLTCFVSCFPIKTVSDISGYKIEKGKEKYHSPNKYTFQIYRSPVVFSRYLSDRFEYINGFSPYNFRLEIEDVWFNFNVIGKEDASRYVDLLSGLILDNEDAELVNNGDTKYFIEIIVTTDNYEDCLQLDSFYRNSITKYLNDLRMGFKAY